MENESRLQALAHVPPAAGKYFMLHWLSCESCQINCTDPYTEAMTETETR